ncbi:MAG: hypothetical protein NVSMB19_22100 [Vulcanimicrobiaceae bacterium]
MVTGPPRDGEVVFASLAITYAGFPDIRFRTERDAASPEGLLPGHAVPRDMTSLDLRERPPRPARETLLGFYLLARTIDKLRAELPGGHAGPYLNHDTGFSAFLVRRLGLDMAEFREAVASAVDEQAVTAWLASRIDVASAPDLNAKLESFVVERMSPEAQTLIRERHPVMTVRPELSKILDVLDEDDRHAFPDHATRMA